MESGGIAIQYLCRRLHTELGAEMYGVSSRGFQTRKTKKDLDMSCGKGPSST